MTGTITQRVEAVLEHIYPEFATTHEVLDYLNRCEGISVRIPEVYVALHALANRGQATYFMLPSAHCVAWTWRSLVGTP